MFSESQLQPWDTCKYAQTRCFSNRETALLLHRDRQVPGDINIIGQESRRRWRHTFAHFLFRNCSAVWSWNFRRAQRLARHMLFPVGLMNTDYHMGIEDWILSTLRLCNMSGGNQPILRVVESAVCKFVVCCTSEICSLFSRNKVMAPFEQYSQVMYEVAMFICWSMTDRCPAPPYACMYVRSYVTWLL